MKAFLSSAIAPALLVGVFLLPSSAKADFFPLGPASGFNVFVFGNDTQTNVDAEGRVAVGGNATFTPSGYTVASKLGGSTTDNLVVGGNYTNTNSNVYGNAVVGGNVNITNQAIFGNLSANGSINLSNGSVSGAVTYGTTFTATSAGYGSATQGTTTLPVDFAAAKTYLTNLSNSLATQTPNGTVTVGSSGMVLSGSNPNLNVFNVNGSDLASATALTINAPAGSTVLVNVNGTADQMTNFQTTINGTDKQHVLYNFSQATSLAIGGNGGGFQVNGSILAPNADINFANGQLNGQLIGNSITGSGEAHNFAFSGDLPTTATPEPSSILLFLSGAAVFLVRRRR